MKEARQRGWSGKRNIPNQQYKVDFRKSPYDDDRWLKKMRRFKHNRTFAKTLINGGKRAHWLGKSFKPHLTLVKLTTLSPVISNIPQRLADNTSVYHHTKWCYLFHFLFFFLSPSGVDLVWNKYAMIHVQTRGKDYQYYTINHLLSIFGHKQKCFKSHNL